MGQADEVDQLVASILISQPTITDRELGQILKLSRQTANRRRHSQCVKELIETHFENRTVDVRRIYNKCLRILEESLNHTDNKIRLSAAIPFLRIMQENLQRSLVPEETIQRIKIDLSFADEDPREISAQRPDVVSSGSE